MKTQRSTGDYGYNMAAATAFYDNRWLPLEQQTTSVLHKPLHRYASKLQHEAAAEERRSYRSNSSGAGVGGLEAMLNGLSNLSGVGHISNGYASVAPTHTEALAAASSKQEIPIYEEHHEDAAVAAVAATANDYGGAGGAGGVGAGAGYSGYGDGGQHIQQHSSAGLHSTIYDYPAAAAGGEGGSHGAGYLPAFGGAEQYKEQQEQAGHHYAYDKISQQQQLELEHASYYSPHEGASSATGASGPHDYEDHADGEEQGSNLLAESNGHDGAQAHSHQSHHHVDIINYVPVKHVKKEHVPVEKPVKIPISHAVIIPIKKPVPIHIPITKQVQVAVEKELKVPVERIIPVPVEKHIPVPVEKRVPYTVIKYLPIKVPKPFPVKVPVFKTVLHKVKGWW
ncbi:uncharacterized protein LOC117792590 [Drosophila innubila]|uniref:uncharacterized protein LOC117792590 n=1 Tax=Drosophila innubila TaxID=198719 RepID=UPI00148BEF91|nr:uncharacterized protein LOC117792590 [Drosophila innubila]